MNPHLIEAGYPMNFRQEEAQKLGEHIKNRRSVVLVGMKRVGISNFLRFFLYHEGISQKYLDSKKYLFIPVDLNDLVEREIYPFWILTFKRLADAVADSNASSNVKKQIDLYFLDSIQSQDLFLTIDYLRKALTFLCDQGYLPTIFFIRFDRMKDAMTHDFFANFQGLIDATHRRLSYVFTSARTLDHVDPAIFTKQSMFVFSDNLFIKPGAKEDAQIIYETAIKQFDLKLSSEFVKELLGLVDGHAQYLWYALISLREGLISKNAKDLFESLIKDERISLQSEELWESLTRNEQEILLRLVAGKKINASELKKEEYLINTGFMHSKTHLIFSPIFESFVKSKDEEMKKEKNASEFSKKENTLLTFLEDNKDEICEREQIVEAVWPEAETLGVTDWAIDRLVARVRTKLKEHNKNYEIVTVKTRGYKLVNING